jgi:hypothetical protein
MKFAELSKVEVELVLMEYVYSCVDTAVIIDWFNAMDQEEQESILNP